MDKIILENFRCFKKHVEVDLKPITLLVGENSTGKTSFLAGIQLAAALAYTDTKAGLDFNKEPFNLGAYDQIASFAGGKGGRAKDFIIGFESCSLHRKGGKGFRLEAKFERRRGQPIIGELYIKDLTSNFEQRAWLDPQAEKVKLIRKTGEKEEVIERTPRSVFHWANWPVMMIIEFLSFVDKEFKNYADLFEPNRTYAIAPVRTKPERTYDPKSDVAQPEGNHVPVLLRQIYEQRDTWGKVDSSIKEYGTKSGLFKRINVRSLGGEADPFQIRVKIAGAPNNLIDVGYGVSQVLPLLVDSIMRDESLILMQQPEVHLHPKAQAELGTFLALQAKTKGKKFIVETHSDYIIDRICLDIRDKTTGLSSDDVIILYFQRTSQKPWVDIWPIKIDQAGNIKNSPKGYRSFFLKEQGRLFSPKVL